MKIKELIKKLKEIDNKNFDIMFNIEINKKDYQTKPIINIEEHLGFNEIWFNVSIDTKED